MGVTEMGPLREDDLAWALVDHYRELLTVDQRTAAFVHLGVGEYPTVIRHVLTVIVTQGKTLSEGIAADVQTWIEVYDRHAEFSSLASHARGATATGCATKETVIAGETVT